MNDTGILPRSGKLWSPTTVRMMLTNPWYIGQYIYNVHSPGNRADRRSENEWIIVENHHEPILDERIFYRLKFMLQRNRRGGVPDGHTYVRKNVHIFGGLLHCAKCGSNMTSNQDRRRANGIRPSIYACGSRRRNQTSCTNKYISDLTLGPFVLNYIANIIRASRTHSLSTTAETLERKLLRGDTFKDVTGIDQKTISQLLNVLNSAEDAGEYRPQFALSGSTNSISEADTLKSKRQKLENALARLNALYLYDDEAMPEKDFVMQRSQISQQLEAVNARLEVVQAADPGSGASVSDDFIRRASYYIMTEKLVEDRYIDYEKYIRTIDPSVPKNFLASVIDRIDVDDSRVASITFKNGIEHRFLYAD